MIKDGKEKRIFDAALKLFTENGIDNTSTASISKEAGIAAGTLYVYFENKEDLINKLYISLKEESIGLICPDTSETVLNYEYLEKLWMNTVEWGINNQDKFRFITQFQSSPYYTEDVKAIVDSYKKNLIGLIKGSIKNKKLKNLPPEYIFELILTHLVYTVGYIVQTKTKERRRFFETLFDAIKI
ncbi:MAG: TetR/AcrR family transcriptional regulator [Methanobacterium sp.]|nr:TetR/AcrR family transcriptional regulator [Methanobacterium sp.]